MMALLFITLLFAALAAWFSYRYAGVFIFGISFVMAIIWFHHHITSKLNLQF